MLYHKSVISLFRRNLTQMKNFIQLKKNIGREKRSEDKNIKVALLGDTATQLLKIGLEGTGLDLGFYPSLFEADYDQLELQIFMPNSELYEYDPQYVILHLTAEKLLGRYDKINGVEGKEQFALQELSKIKAYRDQISQVLPNSRIILTNFLEIDDAVFGNFSTKVVSSFLHQLRYLNFKLMELATQNDNLYIVDILSIQNRIGRNQMFSENIYIGSDMVLNIDSIPLVSRRIWSIIEALEGKFKKCLILDLDNTLWGGVIGDDGIEKIQIGNLGIGKAFSNLQKWAKKLKERGVILAICSKNTESVAKEPFENHPDMVLKMEDISVFVANWENKADNIRYIQSVLNIGFDSMVFLDDNPFERNIVRENIIGITVPELPEDPSLYVNYLSELNLFETVSFSSEDSGRTEMYQNEAKRKEFEKKSTNLEDYLSSLEMYSEIQAFNDFNTPRIAQLTQRSNQYNLRTVRYSEADIKAIANSDVHIGLAFTLTDKFGDNGLICVVILEKRKEEECLFINSWLMSCRVLKRGMELFVLNTIVDVAKNHGFGLIKGEYLPTKKNALVENHYSDLGFLSENGYWFLSTEKYVNKGNHINAK